MNVIEFIDKWKINRKMLSEKTEINYSTLKLKLNPKFSQYNLSDEEYDVIVREIKKIEKDTSRLGTHN